MKIIAFFGPQHCGKSEASKAIVAGGDRVWKRLSFADVIYDMMTVLIGTNSRAVDKGLGLDALGGKTLRYALQTLGTEWGRSLVSEDIWVEAMRRRILAHKAINIVIDDLRFANEHQMLRDLGATIVRLDRIGCGMSTIHTHGSETEWLDFTFDMRFENIGDITAWQVNMKNFAESL